MLKTTKEFDFVYKNSYKFRSESLDICVLRANMAGQFYEKFRRLSCNLVGFSVSKKVGNAVERNLVKRRLRAICREFFGNDNLFWGMQFAPFSHKTALDERSSSISLVSRKNGAKPHRHYFDCDSLHESATNLTQNNKDSSLRGRITDSHEASVRSTDPHLQIQSYRHSELSQSESEESKKNNKQFVDSSRCRAQNDESMVDCHDSALPNLAMTGKKVDCFSDESPRNDKIKHNSTQGMDSRNDGVRQNIICIFIAKGQILQTPFIALKSTIFATLKRQLNFKKNSHFASKMANHYKSPKRESTKMPNRPQTKAMQNENR